MKCQVKRRSCVKVCAKLVHVLAKLVVRKSSLKQTWLDFGHIFAARLQ